VEELEELANDPDQVSFVSYLHSILQMAHIMINVHTICVCTCDKTSFSALT
jgi:hypothetical protein